MYVLSEGNGHYHQTIKIGGSEAGNTLEIMRGREVIYNGVAKNIVDSGSVISFTTPEGENRTIQKYEVYTTA